MADTTIKRMLLAIDGSERSIITVKNIAGFEPFRKMQIKLFHVFNAVPNAYWDLEREPKSVKSVVQVRAWESQQRKEIQKYMEKAKKIFTSRGFDAHQIVIDIHNRAKGVARDIIKEAEAGYDIVVTRRRGLGLIPRITMGSVAAKLIEHLSFTPLVISGRMRPNSNVLIAVDGSESSLRAADFAGRMLAGRSVNIGLIHVLRSHKGEGAKYRHLFTPDEFLESAQLDTAEMLNGVRDRLTAYDFTPDQITIHKSVSAYSRSAAIVEQAKQGDYHLIVLGRRGLSKPKNFAMGTVPNKVIQLTKQSSICVIP